MSSSVLEPLQTEAKRESAPEANTLTLERLFNRYYTARQVAGAAGRTLHDYIKHMEWFRRIVQIDNSYISLF
ncbi:hypothetical protein [Seinonella peptonophila]|uniref:hypothetical protein n=1 Tax=Seinonella peptonophila TaxID=112248 RepID=UPI00111494D1|nr:hypothetical protein [Seinonella peptonophila]